MADFDQPKIVVAGAGGMGALFGAILDEGGLDVILYDLNPQHVAAVRSDGLKITGFGGDRTRHLAITDDAGTIETADIILVQCKGYATEAAATAIKHLTRNGGVAISFQNGLGNEDVIASVIGKENTLGGLTTMAGYMLGPGHIQDFSRVPSYIGELSGGISERTRKIAASLTAAGLETHASADILHDIWKKLLGNIAMSAVSGATNLTSAGALAVPELRQLSENALDEALAVAAAEGIELSRDEAIAGMETISEKGGTGDNKSSLCVDILNRRPTEVEFIYGSVINLARKHGIATPVLDALRAIVKGLESHYLGEKHS